MSAISAGTGVQIRLGGVPLASEVLQALVLVEVESAWDTPVITRLTLQDPPPDLLQGPMFAPLTSLDLWVEETGSLSPLATVEITALRSRYQPDGSLQVILEAQDALHRMAMRQSRTLIREEDRLHRVLEQLCAPLSLQIPQGGLPLSSVPPQLHLHGTDLELFTALVNLLGFHFRLDQGDIRLFAANGEDREAVDLVWGESLLQLHVDTDLSQQKPGVERRGWDAQRQKDLQAQVQHSRRTDLDYQAKPVSEHARQAVPNASPPVQPGPPLQNQSLVDLSAKALSDQLAEAFFILEGACIGRPDVLPGRQIQIHRVIPAHQGPFRVDKVLHRISADEGYVTWFKVGDDPKPTPSASLASRLTPGKVVDVDDPKNLGRVRVRFPRLDASVESDWLRVVHPGAGARQGTFFCPHLDDEVLVAFEGSAEAYVLGGLYSQARRPHRKMKQPNRAKQGFISAQGHRVLIDDKRQIIEVHHRNGSELELNRGGVTVRSSGDLTLADGHGHSLRMTNGEVALECSGALDIRASRITFTTGRVDFYEG